MKIAHEVVIDKGVVIDGVRFPYHVSQDIGVEIDDSGAIVYVTLRLLADRVKVVTDRGVERFDSDRDELAWAREMARETVAREMAPVLRWLRTRVELEEAS